MKKGLGLLFYIDPIADKIHDSLEKLFQWLKVYEIMKCIKRIFNPCDNNPVHDLKDV